MVEFGKHKKIVHDSTCIMNVAASKVSLGMLNMSASEASPCVRAMAVPRILVNDISALAN